MLANKSAGGGSIMQFEGDANPVGQCGIQIWNRISLLTKTAAGGYLYCRKTAFDAIGGFDEKLYASEEIRFSRLLRKWAKHNECTINILTDFPAQTSSRKLAWYSSGRILAWVAFMMLVPFAVYSRSLCSFWYARQISHHQCAKLQSSSKHTSYSSVSVVTAGCMLYKYNC